MASVEAAASAPVEPSTVELCIMYEHDSQEFDVDANEPEAQDAAATAAAAEATTSIRRMLSSPPPSAADAAIASAVSDASRSSSAPVPPATVSISHLHLHVSSGESVVESGIPVEELEERRRSTLGGILRTEGPNSGTASTSDGSGLIGSILRRPKEHVLTPEHMQRTHSEKYAEEALTWWHYFSWYGVWHLFNLVWTMIFLLVIFLLHCTPLIDELSLPAAHTYLRIHTPVQVLVGMTCVIEILLVAQHLKNMTCTWRARIKKKTRHMVRAEGSGWAGFSSRLVSGEKRKFHCNLFRQALIKLNEEFGLPEGTYYAYTEFTIGVAVCVVQMYALTDESHRGAEKSPRPSPLFLSRQGQHRG